ncbi:hypothetical protein ACNYS0_20080 [Streptomyces sp. BH034]|uniref:hypothetical protein n=1 Tax=Streptomyces sp. BH034 TaxID=3402626 RepID=UPI003BB6EFFB
MTLDAMHWVWAHARARGNARLVLLAVADKTTGPDATARMGTTELAGRLAAARSTVLAAVDKALASGELVVAEQAAGSRAALYRLPGAVDYARPDSPATGRNPVPPPAPDAPFENTTTNGQRSESATTDAPGSGRDLEPQAQEAENGLWSESATTCGRKVGPHHAPIEGVSEGGRERVDPRGTTAAIPEFARPLVDQITAAGAVVRWDLTPTEWFTLDALIKRSGADMLAAHAARAAQRREVSHARYFLRAWRDLPPAPAPGTTAPAPAFGPGTNVIPLAAAQPRRGRVAAAADMFAAALATSPQEPAQ